LLVSQRFLEAYDRMPVRWVGFDMDECIGSLMPLFTYIQELPACVSSHKERVDLLLSIANTLYQSEQRHQTWLIRPAMMEALRLVYDAWHRGAIKGAFVYSNNSSPYLVQFVGFWMNVCIQQLLQRSDIPDIFQMAVWNGAPCREPYGSLKSFHSIQACLAAHGLPECSSVHDLLFFDDMSHLLEYQITHYIKVPPYYNHTPAIAVVKALSPIGNTLRCAQWTTLAAKSMDQQDDDFRRPDNRYVMEQQSNHEYQRDIEMYRSAFRTFLRTPL